MAESHLPSPPTSFVGREQELADIQTLLADPTCRLLTLIGPGGIGKTRLSIEAGRRLVDSTKTHAFPDGVYFVPLQPLTAADLIVSTIAETLRFPFYGEQDPRTQLLDYLRSKWLLLVLDNFEHLLDGVDLLTDILEAAPRVKLVVTSRERLRLREEWVCDVRGLPYPEGNSADSPNDYSAVQLFVQNARRMGYAPQDADSDSVVRICQMVEGIPLAIELAAAWVRVMPCSEITREVEHSLDILTTTTRNVPEKHRSMRAVFEHSWNLLSEAEQGVFRKLAVFRGGFTREAAEQVAGSSLAILALLVDRSLLRMDSSGRYSLQELLRQYAHYQLERADEFEATCDAHSAYYAGVLERAGRELKGPNQVKTLDALDTDLDNLRVAWEWAVRQGKADEIHQAMEGLFSFYLMRWHYQEGFDAFDTAVKRFGNVENELSAHLMLLDAWFVPSTQKTLEHQKKGMSILRQLGIDSTVTIAMRGFIFGMDEFGGYDALKRLYQDHLATARKRGDAWGTAWMLHCIGTLDYFVGKYAQAQPILQESIVSFQAIGDVWGLALVNSTLGQVMQCMKRYEEAFQYHQEHLRLSREVGNRNWIVFALGKLGIVANDLGDSDTFKRHFREVFKQMEIGTITALQSSYVLEWEAKRLLAAGEKEQAVELFALIVKHYEGWDEGRRVADQLDTLKSEFPPEIFAAAVWRGEANDLEATVIALLKQFAGLDEQPSDAPIGATYPQDQALDEPLNEREIEILRLIADGLNSRDVAEALYLSVETVRWYLKHLYSKLDAHSRTQAIARARELNLLA